MAQRRSVYIKDRFRLFHISADGADHDLVTTYTTKLQSQFSGKKLVVLLVIYLYLSLYFYLVPSPFDEWVIFILSGKQFPTP